MPAVQWRGCRKKCCHRDPMRDRYVYPQSISVSGMSEFAPAQNCLAASSANTPRRGLWQFIDSARNFDERQVLPMVAPFNILKRKLDAIDLPIPHRNSKGFVEYP